MGLHDVSHELQAHEGAQGSEGGLTEPLGGALLREKKGRQRLNLSSDFRQSQGASLV